MKTIAIVGHKGGLGKTTLTILFAAMAIMYGKRVAMLDLDEQRSLTEWWEARPEEDPLKLIGIDKPKDILTYQASLESMGFDYLFIDTPPAPSETIRAGIETADLVVVPCSPSPLDLKGIGETISVLESEGKAFFFVINKAISRTTIANETLAVLASHGKVAPVSLAMRTDYARGLIGGGTPLDTKNQKIIDEVEGVYKYLQEQLGKVA